MSVVKDFFRNFEFTIVPHSEVKRNFNYLENEWLKCSEIWNLWIVVTYHMAHIHSEIILNLG